MGTPIPRWDNGWILEDAIAFFNEAYACRPVPPLELSHFALQAVVRKDATFRENVRMQYAVLKLEGAIQSTKYPTASFLVIEYETYAGGFLIALEDANLTPLGKLWVSTNPSHSTRTCPTALLQFFDPRPAVGNRPEAPPPTACDNQAAAKAVTELRIAQARAQARDTMQRHLSESRKWIAKAIQAIPDHELLTQQWIDRAQSETARQIFSASSPPTPPNPTLLATRLSALLRRCDALKD
jgi:hypothetical protein